MVPWERALHTILFIVLFSTLTQLCLVTSDQNYKLNALHNFQDTGTTIVHPISSVALTHVW